MLSVRLLRQFRVAELLPLTCARTVSWENGGRIEKVSLNLLAMREINTLFR